MSVSGTWTRQSDPFGIGPFGWSMSAASVNMYFGASSGLIPKYKSWHTGFFSTTYSQTKVTSIPHSAKAADKMRSEGPSPCKPAYQDPYLSTFLCKQFRKRAATRASTINLRTKALHVKLSFSFNRRPGLQLPSMFYTYGVANDSGILENIENEKIENI